MIDLSKMYHLHIANLRCIYSDREEMIVMPSKIDADTTKNCIEILENAISDLNNPSKCVTIVGMALA